MLWQSWGSSLLVLSFAASSKGNQNIATVAGAAAGAAAGNAIQNRVTDDTYNIHVRMDDGRTVVINQRDLGGIRENTYVRVVNGRVVLR